MTSPPRRPAAPPRPVRSQRPGLVKSRALAAAVDLTALLGWLRVPWPWALCAASPGGGKAIIAQRRSTYLSRLCKAHGGRPRAAALTPQRPGMRGGEGGPGSRGGASSGSRCGCRPVPQERAAARHRWGWGDPRSHPAWPPAGVRDVGGLPPVPLNPKHLLCVLGVETPPL